MAMRNHSIKLLSLQSHFLSVSTDLSLHYRDSGQTGRPPLLLLHSLSDNTHAFDAVIAAGLENHFRIIVPDLRGRGRSSRPPTGYDLEDHCADLLALLDSLGIEKAFVAGHSFGGFLGLYFAAHYPQRVLGLTLIDAAVELHPLTPAFVVLLSDRLGKWYPARDVYLQSLRIAPYITYWDADMERAFLADTVLMAGDSLYVATQKYHMAQCALAVEAVSKRDWRRWAMQVPGPSLVIAATDPFLLGQHILQPQKALETAVLMPGGDCGRAKGNHITMLFGPGAKDIATHIINRFLY